MAKALVAALLCAMLVAGLAADTGRDLLQSYDCKQAKEMLTVNDACGLLCKCATAIDKQYSEGQCKTMCGTCLEDVKKCSSGPVPSSCSTGTGNKAVNQCISTYLKSRSG